MDIKESSGESPSLTFSEASTLTANASSLKRLDDKLATGMTIADVAKARWLTNIEVLQYLDRAQSDNWTSVPLNKSPPAIPPHTGNLLVYNSVDTPNYSNDGIEWISDPGVKWKSIERVLERYGDSQSVSDTNSQASELNNIDMGMEETGENDSQAREASSGSSSALHTGASAEYLSCATRNTFHRREYRGPNNTVLLHYLDSIKALRITSELVDKIVMLSADADANLPKIGGGSASGTSGSSSGDSEGSGINHVEVATQPNLGDTMNILMEMVDEHDAQGTSAAEAVDEHVLKAANDAAFSAVMKHLAPNEAMGVVGAMENAMEDNMVSDEDLAGIDDVTAFEIDEAISQVLSGNAPADGNGKEGGSTKRSVSSSSGSERGTAAIIEDRILDSIEEVLPEDLRLKLINTTEVMLDAAGVSLKSRKGTKSDRKDSISITPIPVAPRSTLSSPISTGAAPGASLGHALPEIIDITPDFHTMGYQPLNAVGAVRKNSQHMHQHSVVISTGTPIPKLPPYVDLTYTWEVFASFVNFQEVADDPQVRKVSFNHMTPLTPFSYKVKMPTDIPNYSVRHIIIIGVLLPKDHRVKRNLRGIELALKLTLQTEWSAAADLVGAYDYAQQSKNKGGSSTPLVKGIKRPIFIAPCGGNRMQLLSQISKTRFTMYPASSLPQALSNAMSSAAAPNFVQRVALRSNETNDGVVKSVESKRKRENFFEEWASTPGIDASMTTAEVDRNRKVRFVERISTAITKNKNEPAVLTQAHLSVGSSFSQNGETTLDGVNVEDMPEEEIDGLLGRVLIRYVEVCINRSETQEELLGEINWSGYSGLSLLHHASIYNFMALTMLLLNNGANTNILSAEGDLTPLHFAAAAGHEDVVEVLIRHGCNPIPTDAIGETPADHARRAGHVGVTALLSAYMEQAGIKQGEDNNMDTGAKHWTTTDMFLQSAFRELSLRDKLGLNLFVDRSKAAPLAFVRKSSAHMIMDGDVDGENLDNKAFNFISETDRVRLREAMSLASEMDLKEMNLKAEHQDVRRYLRQSNYEAISAASEALDKANRKESDILKNASQKSDDPSKMQLSRALAMLVLRKNLPADG